MSLNHNPNMVTSGLVFAYDMGNTQKSWKGAPVTNLITETNLNNWSKSATTATSNFQTPFKAPAYAITDNNTGSYLSISRNITVANSSSSYTVSLFVKKTSGATSARLGFNIGFDTGGTTVSVNARFNSDTGVATTGTVVSRGDWWYWYFTISNNGTGNTNLFCNFYPATGIYNSGDNVVGVGTAIIGELMIVAGSVPARFVSGTRANTQAILDLTGNNTITAESLTYNADGTFSFDGTANYITIPNTTLGNGNIPWTVSTWMKTTTTTNALGQGAILSNAASGPVYSVMGVNNGKIVYWTYQSSAWSQKLGVGKTVNDGNWHMLTWVNYNNFTMDMYVDGLLDSNVPNSTSGNNNPVDRIGGSWNSRFPGSISALSRYNRALTATEVLRNYNALKGRYGL